jgi:ABC-type amino acid transport substrate-binding protein
VIAAGLLALISVAAPARAADAPRKIRIATEDAYAPFNFKAPDGSLRERDVDIAKARCAEARLANGTDQKINARYFDVSIY